MVMNKEDGRKLSTSELFVVATALFLTAAILFVLLPRVAQASADAPLYTVGLSDGYDLIAKNLADGKGFRFEPYTGETMMREPGYPLFLAAAFKIGGYKLSAARWANWILTCGIAFMILRLAKDVTGDRAAALASTLLFLFYPSTIIAESRGGVEILFIFVVLAFLLCLQHAMSTGRWWHFLAAGLALGVVVQVRSTPLVFPFFLLLYFLIVAPDWSTRLRAFSNVTMIVAGMVVVMVPWLVRNFQLVHHLVPTATVQGVALQEGQFTCRSLAPGQDFYALQRKAGLQRAALAEELRLPFEGAYYYQFFYDPHDEWMFNQELLRRAKSDYSQHPGFLVRCSCKNLFNFWFLGKTWNATWINLFIQSPLLLLAGFGLYLLWRRMQLSKIGVILAFAFSILAVSVPIIAHARHSVPLVPLLSIPAGVAIISIWQKWKLLFQDSVREASQTI